MLAPREASPTKRAVATSEVLLDRYGVVTRGAVLAERVPGGFNAVYPVLKAAEESGRARRGYFVEGLGGAQFAIPGAVDRMRGLAQPTEAPEWTTPVPGGWDSRRRREPDRAVVLAATDPANPYGAALSWPDREQPGGHRPGRKAGALVVLVDGALVLYVERGGKSLLTFTDAETLVTPAVDALALAVRDGHLGKLTVERADGGSLLAADAPLAAAFKAAGFHATPRGLRLRA
jgi:ATP-dependent Lhr-like helicase